MRFRSVDDTDTIRYTINVAELCLRRSKTAQLRKDLETDREVVVTANGRPFAIMTPVEPDRFEEEILAIRRARAAAALSRIRAEAKADGLDRMTMDEIDAVIAEARRERRRAE